MPLDQQRGLMSAAVSAGLYANAVDIAKRDKTGTLKSELKKTLNARCDAYFQGMSEDDAANNPTIPEEKALSELER